MKKEIKLKPCPFCGQDSAGFANAGFGFIVKCRKCGTKTDKQNTTEEAAAFWNERKPLSDIVPSNSIEFLVKFTRTLADILAENKRLRDALEKIVIKTNEYERRLPGPFMLAIRLYAQKALKGGEKC